MKTAYLTAGPRGAGKSTYVSMVQKCSPEILVVNSDELFIREFGADCFDPYSGMHIVAAQLLKQEIEKVFNLAKEDAKIIIDAWNGFPSKRIGYIRYLRELGVGFVVCWYFVTPLSACIKWFQQKPECTSIRIDSIKWDWKLYHEQAADIDYPNCEIYRPEIDEFNYNRKFDMICRINPLQLSLPGVTMI